VPLNALSRSKPLKTPREKLQEGVNKFVPTPVDRIEDKGCVALVTSLQSTSMRLRIGSKALIAIGIALTMALGALAIVQYRWSGRVASADLQGERERLQMSGSLFANRFNHALSEVAVFLQQGDVQQAIVTATQLPAKPALLKDLYFVDPEQPKVRHLNSSGQFVTIAKPDWMQPIPCMRTRFDRPLTIMIHIPSPDATTRCLVAQLDENAIQTDLVPTLLRETFGDTILRDYEFAITSRTRHSQRLYGPWLIPDLRIPLGTASDRPMQPGRPRLQSEARWDLEIARRGGPLAAAFRRQRWQNLALGLITELFFGTAILLLLVAGHRMQQVADQRMQFVAAISHELRTPVASISMLSRNQADGLVQGNDKVTQYGELIHQQSRRLSEMVEAALQYAGIHSNLGKPVRKPIDIPAAIQKILTVHAEELAAQQIHVDVEVSAALPMLQGDPNLLRIALDNLFTNAIKYAGKGQWIGVRAEHVAQEIGIHISDHGPGIDESEQRHLFEPFYRGSNTSTPGAGIGLSLVRSITQAHHGTINMTTAMGQGTTFTLRLPL